GALVCLEDHQMAAHFAGINERMLNQLAPAAQMPLRMLYANTWLFGPLMAAALSRDPHGSPAIRTTTAETMIRGGVKDNVLPNEATAVVNFRIMPGDTVQTVVDYVRRTIDEPRIQIRTLPDAHDPSPVSGADTTGYD